MSRARLNTALAIYGSLGALSWLATAAVDRSPWHQPAVLGGARWISLPGAIIAGLSVGTAGVALSQWLARNSRWGRALQRELQLGLAGLAPSIAAPLALASAVGEELFFRGALQTGLVAIAGRVWGIALAASVFGLVHIPWNRRLLTWTLMAGVMGLVFGALYLATGELLAPIVAHALINYVNLRYILAHQPERPWAVRLRA